MGTSASQTAAQTELDRLLQGRTRLFCLGLAGLTACEGLLSLALQPPADLRLEGSLAVLTLASMGLLAHWLGKPRPPYLVDFAAVTAALLAVAAALVHLALSGNPEDTTHLMLIVIGAGYFVGSLGWFLGLAAFAALGWVAASLPGQAGGLPLSYGGELGTAMLLGLLINRVRRDLLKQFLDLLIQNHRHQDEQAQIATELRAALEKVKTLHGLIPICGECKKIRDDHGYWQQVEDYVRDHSEAEFSHSLCPACLEKAKADFEAYLDQH